MRILAQPHQFFVDRFGGENERSLSELSRQLLVEESRSRKVEQFPQEGIESAVWQERVSEGLASLSQVE